MKAGIVTLVRWAAAASTLSLAAPASAQESAAPPAQTATSQQPPSPTRPYAFPDEQKEPLDDAAHVRNAVARFRQVKGVTDAERDAAWVRIQAAAERFGVSLQARDWRELKRPKAASIDGRRRRPAAPRSCG